MIPILTASNLEFPYLETGYSCRKYDPFCELEHTHDFYEVTYCLTGNVTHFINGKEYAFPSNSIFILPPNNIHYHKNFEDATGLTICIHSDKFDSLLKSFSTEDVQYINMNDGPLFVQISARDEAFFRNICRHIFLCKPQESIPYIILFLNRVLSCKLQQDLDSLSVSDDFFKAVAEMQKLDNAREGVPAFLRIANMSHTHLCRLTNTYLDIKPHDFVNNIRLQHAHSFVTMDNIPYEEIAERVGFSSYPHFCKLFRQMYHISPAQLRKKKRKVI